MLTGMHNIIVENRSGHWNAWDESSPGVAFGGDSPTVALEWLFDSHGWNRDSIEAGGHQSDDRLTFVVRDLPCPDCSGTGRYVGLSASSLEKKRADGGGPRFVRLGGRAIGYDVRDLDAWLDTQRKATEPQAAARRVDG